MKTVLLVDDEPGILSAVSELLTQHEFSVVAEPHLGDGLAACARYTPDIVLCDLILMDVRPVAVLPAIRARLPDTPIVLMSSMAEANVRAMVSGDYGFLQKPFTVAQLLAHMHAALESRRYLRAVNGQSARSAR